MLTEFLKQDDGTQVIEYALIIGLISIALVVALQPASIASGFSNFMGRVAACLTTGPCV